MNFKSKPILKYQRKVLEKALAGQKPPKGKEENLNLKLLKNSLKRVDSFSSQSSEDMQRGDSIKEICRKNGIKITRTQEMHINDIIRQKDRIIHQRYQKSGLSARREERKRELSSSSSSSSLPEKEAVSDKKRPKLLVSFDFDAAPALTQSNGKSQNMGSPTQFKQDEVLHHISTSEQKDSTQKNTNINIVERKQQVMEIFQGQFNENEQVIIEHSSSSD